MAPAPCLPGVDALKGLACVLIGWHHLAFYGPMSDVVHRAAPWLMNWLYTYGRMAKRCTAALNHPALAGARCSSLGW